MECLLGRGGMGAVYRAVDERSGDVVALKVLGEGMGDDEKALRRFELELAALERLDHPSVVRARGGMVQQDGHVFFPLEYVDGHTLRDLLDAEGALPLGRAVRVARALLEALAAAHSVSVVHRDVKPSNILLPRGAPDDALKVADFGLARLTDATRVTKTGTLLGTLHYMSPEQCEGTRSIDARADLYSAGIVLYEMLSGRPPLRADTPVALLRAHMVSPPPPIEAARPDVPPDLARFIADCLAKRPDDRVQTAAAAVDRLDALGELPETRELAPEPPASRLSSEAETRMRVAPTRTAVAPAVVASTVASAGSSTVGSAGAAAGSPAGSDLAPRRRWVPIAAVVGLALAAAVGLKTLGGSPPQPDGANDVPEAQASAFALGEIAGALRTEDFERFRGAFSRTLRETLLSGATARERFELACRNEDPSDFHPSGAGSDLEGSRMRVVVKGAVLPAALGSAPNEAPHGVQLDLEQDADERWVVRAWQPAKFVAGRDTSATFAAAERALHGFMARPDSWLEIARLLGADRVPPKRRKEMREWVERVRRGDAVAPPARYELKPDQFDAERLIWTVPVDAPQMAEKLGRPGARIELVLKPTRDGPRRRLRFTLADARFVR